MKDLIKPANEQEAIQMLHRYNEDVLPQKFGKAGKTWVVILLVIIAFGVYNYIQQIRFGLSVTGLSDTVSWGIYISNFVFFVAVSLVGSLITAVLYLLNVKWRAPLTRISEVIAVSAIMFVANTSDRPVKDFVDAFWFVSEDIYIIIDYYSNYLNIIPINLTNLFKM
jgi:hypothetical protein